MTMRIALLTNESVIHTLFAQRHPEVKVYTHVTRELLEAECIIITTWYQVENEYVQILNLWERYMRIRLSNKKLVVLGWVRTEASNSLNFADIPKLDTSWIRTLPRAGAGREHAPSYPEVIDRDIVPILRKVLHSHGRRPFKKVLNQAQTPLRKIEKAIEENQHQDFFLKMEERQGVMDQLARAKQIWDERKAFFSLMPQFPDMQKFECIWSAWERLYDHYQKPAQRLSQQLRQYQIQTLQDILRLYGMEKEGAN